MFHVVFCIILLLIYMLAVVDQLPRLGKKEANLSTAVHLKLFGFCPERFPIFLGTWDGLRYFIVALTEPSI